MPDKTFFSPYATEIFLGRLKRIWKAGRPAQFVFEDGPLATGLCHAVLYGDKYVSSACLGRRFFYALFS
jgi:hypothetical protein